MRYHPGETNLRMADVILISKADTAPPGAIEAVRAAAGAANPQAAIVEAGMPPVIDKPELLPGRRVLVVEDGPTITHGGMAYGAGYLAARRAGAEIIDPRPYAVGTLSEVLEHYPHLGPVLPAMGYGAEQLHDLEATINRAGTEVVVLGTPADLSRVLTLRAAIVRVGYEIEDRTEPTLRDILTRWVRDLGRGTDHEIART
jgi:predicted GTPase